MSSKSDSFVVMSLISSFVLTKALISSAVLILLLLNFKVIELLSLLIQKDLILLGIFVILP